MPDIFSVLADKKKKAVERPGRVAARWDSRFRDLLVDAGPQKALGWWRCWNGFYAPAAAALIAHDPYLPEAELIALAEAAEKQLGNVLERSVPPVKLLAAGARWSIHYAQKRIKHLGKGK